MSPEKKMVGSDVGILWGGNSSLPVIYKTPKTSPFFRNQPTAPVKNSPSKSSLARAERSQIDVGQWEAEAHGVAPGPTYPGKWEIPI